MMQPALTGRRGARPAGKWALVVRAVHAAAFTLVAMAPAGAQDAAPQWLPVPPQSLEIAEGSALDLSAIAPRAPAGEDGPLVIGPGGTLHFTGAAASRRFSCAVLSTGWSGANPFQSHADADRLATQLRRRGYDLVRFHYVDARLMARRTRDFDPDPEQLDRFYYLLAALKRNGIYWSMDMLTAPNGGSAGKVAYDRSAESLKVRVNFDPQARARWMKLVDTLYNRVNPYTGKTILADPALAFAVTANENSLAFTANWAHSQNGPFPRGLDSAFNLWLKKKYGTTAALAKSLPDLGLDETVEAGTVRLPSGWSTGGQRGLLFQTFVSDTEVETYDWMTARLRERGFNGPTLAFHAWYAGLTNRTRARLPIIDVHAYVGEVSSYDLGRTWKLPSSFERDIGDLRANLAARWYGKPIVATEYGHPFWAPSRYEGGLVFPALAAFQDFGFICRHADSSVELAVPAPGPGTRPVMPYSIGLDPAARAGETLAALLFRRGDVAPAKHMVVVPFGPEQFARSGSGFIPRELNLSVFVTGFGLIDPGKVGDLPQDVLAVAYPGSSLPSFVPPQVGKAIEHLTGAPDVAFAALVRKLRANGTLPPDNVTDPAKGLFQNETGEILFDSRQKQFQAVTPRTEAVATGAVRTPLRLSTVTLRSTSSGALIAASSLDGAALRESRRILLILSGDAVNTGMAFGDTERRKIMGWGRLPVLMERVTADLRLDLAKVGTARLTALALDGSPMETKVVPVASDGALAVTLDTGAVKDRPTTFFLLETEAR